MSGDGCSELCVVEDGYQCTAVENQVSVCIVPNVCGDGDYDSSTEACDDGNIRDDDGCSSTCDELNTTDFECYSKADYDLESDMPADL